MARSLIYSDVHVIGNLSSQTLEVPAGSVVNASVSPTANIDHDKTQDVVFGRHVQASGADVAAATQIVHCVRGANGATLLEVAVTLDTAPTGGNKQFTVDVQKGNSAGAFATVLSAVVTIDNTKANRTTYTGTITTSAFAQHDICRVVVTPSGSTGSQGQGVSVSCKFKELP